ncbi:MAG: hypothetical protein NDI94_00040 [Candidatus Woesearchaeota archaeon]|nr:hypothetical protein [Candidatus Woesearchaeota archaeon]
MSLSDLLHFNNHKLISLVKSRQLGSDILFGIHMRPSFMYEYQFTEKIPAGNVPAQVSPYFLQMPACSARTSRVPKTDELLTIGSNYMDNLESLYKNIGELPTIEIIYFDALLDRFTKPIYQKIEWILSIENNHKKPFQKKILNRSYFMGTFGDRCVYSILENFESWGATEEIILIPGAIINSDLGTKRLSDRIENSDVLRQGKTRIGICQNVADLQDITYLN